MTYAHALTRICLVTLVSIATSCGGETEPPRSLVTRGAADTINMFGGNCFDCHSLAEPQWDFVCSTDHGCDPLGVTESFIALLQRGDPRCQ